VIRRLLLLALGAILGVVLATLGVVFPLRGAIFFGCSWTGSGMEPETGEVFEAFECADRTVLLVPTGVFDVSPLPLGARLPAA